MQICAEASGPWTAKIQDKQTRIADKQTHIHIYLRELGFTEGQNLTADYRGLDDPRGPFVNAMDRSRLEAVAQYTVPPARGRITGYRIGDEQSAGIETALLPIIAVGARAKGGNGRVFELGKFDKSGRDSVAATLKLLQSARHCKYDRNENKRGHISHQMTASAGSLRA